MSKRPFLLFTVCAVAFTSLAVLSSCVGNRDKIAFEQAQTIDARPFLSEAELLRSLSEESWAALGLGGLREEESGVLGLVVPHHAAAAALAAEAISRLAENPPPTVIILAPNHYNTGSVAIGTTSDFICYGKKVESDAVAVKRLASAGLVSVSDEPFEREHSVGMLLPVVAWYLPDVKVIPVIFHHGCETQKILEIIEALKAETEAGAVIVASIDFSHYLTMAEAEEKDREIKGYMESGDIETIAGLDSSYVDSPTILAAMLAHFGAENMEIIANTNSGVIMQNQASQCTSYFTIRFCGKK